MSWFAPQQTNDVPGLSVTTSNVDAEGTTTFNNGREAVIAIFKSNKCYDIIPNSTKVFVNKNSVMIIFYRILKAIVFETDISFQLAFYALVEHGRHKSLVFNEK